MSRGAPPRRPKTDISHVTARNMVQKRLLSDYGSSQDWKAVGAKYGISGGMAYRVAMHAYEPQRTHIRLALGFPALAPAPCCPDCGIPHVTRRCPRRRKPARPRRDWKGAALVLLAAWLAGGLAAGENPPRR